MMFDLYSCANLVILFDIGLSIWVGIDILAGKGLCADIKIRDNRLYTSACLLFYCLHNNKF